MLYIEKVYGLRHKGNIGLIKVQLLYYKQGKEIYLKDDKLKKLAEQEQDKHLSVSNLTGEVLMHLEKKLPKNWAEYDMTQRRMFYMGGEFGTPKEGELERTKVCVMEVWCEMLGEQKNTLTTGKSKEIKEIILKRGIGRWIIILRNLESHTAIKEDLLKKEKSDSVVFVDIL